MTKKIICSAIVYYGPGHQSWTRCECTKRGHKTHFVCYCGEDQEYVEWKGLKAFIR